MKHRQQMAPSFFLNANFKQDNLIFSVKILKGCFNKIIVFWLHLARIRFDASFP
uniref:Uncharacterized protein n=1 Tax=Rhizophora mucronata TaxID=61149 RepID=A0A2P2P587_RHIMU